MSTRRRNAGQAANPAAPSPAVVPPPPSTTVYPPSPPSSWLNPSTWSLSARFFPVYVALLAAFIAIYYFRTVLEPGLDLSSPADCAASFDYTFPINAVLQQTRDYSKATSSRDIGIAFDALTQVRNPERWIFGQEPFPGGKVPQLPWRLDWTSDWASQVLGRNGEKVVDGGVGEVGGNASLGIMAVLLGQRWKGWARFAEEEKRKLIEVAPRWNNGAIMGMGESELRAEMVDVIPPFLAYYGVANIDMVLVKEAFNQIKLYREALLLKKGSDKGLWSQSMTSSGGDYADASTRANAAAAYGMLKTRAILANWTPSRIALSKEISELDTWIGEIVDAAIQAGPAGRTLLPRSRSTKQSPSDVSATAIMVGVVYRAAMFNPQHLSKDAYLAWARGKRYAVNEHIDPNGFVRTSSGPYTDELPVPGEISPQAQANLLIMGTAWRDSVCAGTDLDSYLLETNSQLARWKPLEEVLASVSLDSLTGGYFSHVYKYLQKP